MKTKHFLVVILLLFGWVFSLFASLYLATVPMPPLTEFLDEYQC